MKRAYYLPTGEVIEGGDVIDLMGERPPSSLLARKKKNRRRPVIRTLHVFMLCLTAVVVTLIHHCAGVVEAAAQMEIARALHPVVRPSIEITPDGRESFNMKGRL